ncbi:MAG: hypothetical protein RIG62_25375 [Cyclobacteriaceae bacterium]
MINVEQLETQTTSSDLTCKKMRDKIWYNFIRSKYQAIYLCYFNSYLRTIDRVLIIITTVSSSGSIGGWLIWTHVPYLWASILGVAQLINIIKPLLPYLKDKEQLSETYIFYETLHLDYEKLWIEFEASEDVNAASKKYFELKEKELQILGKLKNIRVNNYKKIERLARRDWAEYLSINYDVKVEK